MKRSHQFRVAGRAGDLFYGKTQSTGNYADKLTAERMRHVITGYNFTGTKKSELMRERLNWRTIERADDLVKRVRGVENLHGHEFDRIRKEVKEGELVVTGEKAVAERVEGLGGSFTYCTLGEPV